MFGGTVQSEDISGINFGGGFIGILATNNANYSKLHDLGFNTGIGIWTAATDIGFVADNLSFGGYASWINGGTWSHRMDAPAGDGGFFDANSVSNILTRVNSYGGAGSVSQKLDDWFNEDFWRAEYSGASTDFFESCKYPQTLNQRQTSHTFFEAQQANGACYRGITSIGMAILTRDSRNTGVATFDNLIVKQASRYLFYGDLGGMTMTNLSGEAMTPITGSNDPYRSATTQEGAVVFAGGASSAGNTQATLNGIYWTSPSSNITEYLWSLNCGGSAAGNPVNTIYSNNECNNVTTGQPGQNPSFQSAINFNQGAVVGAVNGVTSPLSFNAWYSNGSHQSAGIEGEYNGLAILGPDLAAHYLDIQYGAVASSQPFSAPSLTDTGAASTSGTSCLQINTAGLISNTGASCGSGGSGGGGGVSSFAAPSGSWPAWLAPTVTNANTAPSLAVASSLTMANVGAGTAPTGAFVFPGTITAGTTNSVLNAAEFPGSDCGAKINAADTALGSTGGEIDVNLACGTTWTTQVVLSANHNLVFTQPGVYVVPQITVSGSNIVDLRGAELQIPAYSTVASTAGMFSFYNGSTVASNVTIENGIVDGNWSNTPTANQCFPAICRPAIRITNGGNSTPVHDIQVRDVTFQNWNNPAFVMAGHDPTPYVSDFPQPYNITIEGDGTSCQFKNMGGNGLSSYGWDHNFTIRGCLFKNWANGLTGNADAFNTSSADYPGTSEYDLSVTDNTFENTHISSNGYGFVGEIPAGGTGYVTGFKFQNNVVLDDGTGYGGCLSGEYIGAVISGNYWSSGGVCEATGNAITIDDNTIVNGDIMNFASPFITSFASEVAGNTITLNGNNAFSNVQGIQISGWANESSAVTQVIKQSGLSFNVSGGAVAFTPAQSNSIPPIVTITSSAITGGASNAYVNQAFTVAGAANTGNNGTFIVTASTANSISYVAPRGWAETLPSGATITSSAATADYVNSAGYSFGSFNGLAGQEGIVTSGFTNATNNTGGTVATATAYSSAGGAMTITAPNALSAGQVVLLNATSGDNLHSLNGQQFTVLSAGLSSSQFEIANSNGGSGSTSSTFTIAPLTAIANSLTVMALTNPSAVNETHAGTLTVAPSIHNANVGPDSINLGPDSGFCAGVAVGYGSDGQGPVFNALIHDVSVTAPLEFAGNCGAFEMNFGTGIPESSGIEFDNDDATNLGAGYWFVSAPNTAANITINGGSLINVFTPFDIPSGESYRAYNYVTSPSQKVQNLDGGTTVDASGDISSPGWVSGGIYTPATSSGAVAWSGSVAVNSVVLSGNVTSSTIANGSFNGQQVCFEITQGSSVSSIVWPSNMQGMSQPSQTASYSTYQCAVYVAASSTWQAMAPAIDGLGNAYLPGTMNAPAIVDRGLPSATVTGTNGSGALVSASSTGTGNVVLANGPTFTGNTTTFANGAAAEQDVVVQPGTGADQVGAFGFNNYSGTSEWKLRKDANNYFKLTDAVNSLDREVFYQSGQTLINAGAGANAVLINGTSNSGTGGLLVENGGSSPSAVFTVSSSGNTTATGFVSGKFIMGTGTMGLGAGAAAGSGPAIACASGHVCDGLSGTVTLTTGTGTTTGTLATLSFPNTHSNSANCVVTPTLNGTGLVTSIGWSESTTALTLTANAALTASTAYQIRYWCGGN
jgi:hypothetical protein